MKRVALFVLLSLSACDSAGADAVEVRVGNASQADFTSLVVEFPDGPVPYGALGSGDVTAYREAEGAYRYTSVSLVAGGQEYAVVPFDYVGEEPLEPGRYTYVLGIAEGDLRISLEED